MAIKIDVISGFLGAGKTTLIRKLLMDALKGQQVVLIENEFGEIGIDGGFLKDAGIQIREMNSGCICCSLVGDFGTALKALNSFEGIAVSMAEGKFHDYDPYRFPEIYDSITAGDVLDFIRENLVAERCAVSIIDPLAGKEKE